MRKQEKTVVRKYYWISWSLQGREENIAIQVQ